MTIAMQLSNTSIATPSIITIGTSVGAAHPAMWGRVSGIGTIRGRAKGILAPTKYGRHFSRTAMR